MSTETNKRTREDEDGDPGTNKRAREDEDGANRIPDDMKMIVYEHLDTDTFETNFFSDKIVRSDVAEGDDPVDPDGPPDKTYLSAYDVDDLANSQTCLNAFKSCISGDRVVLPPDGLPKSLSDLEKDFVETVLECIEDGALDNAVKYLEENPAGFEKAACWPQVAEMFFDVCSNAVESSWLPKGK
jgi:hypothetical protein